MALGQCLSKTASLRGPRRENLGPRYSKYVYAEVSRFIFPTVWSYETALDSAASPGLTLYDPCDNAGGGRLRYSFAESWWWTLTHEIRSADARRWPLGPNWPMGGKRTGGGTERVWTCPSIISVLSSNEKAPLSKCSGYERHISFHSWASSGIYAKFIFLSTHTCIYIYSRNYD